MAARVDLAKLSQALDERDSPTVQRLLHGLGDAQRRLATKHSLAWQKTNDRPFHSAVGTALLASASLSQIKRFSLRAIPGPEEAAAILRDREPNCLRITPPSTWNESGSSEK